MERFWAIFCGDSDCANDSAENCSLSFYALISRYTCLNDILIISYDILLLLILALIVIYKSVSKKPYRPSQSRSISQVLCISGIFNGALGLVYLGLVLWITIKRLDKDKTILPIHIWLVMLFQGSTLLLLNVAVILKRLVHQRIAALRFCLILNVLFSGFIFVSSLWKAVSDRIVSVELVLDILSFPGAILFLFSAYQQENCAETESKTNIGAFYEPLPGKEDKENVTNFSRAGFFSKMSFWWLNRLMKKGNQKILEDNDIPQLSKEDQARTCHLICMEELRKRKRKGLSDSLSILSIIISWKRKELVISGLFALLKVITMSTSPLFLKAFIDVAEGKEAFKYEGYVLTAGLFLVKCLESLSERHWYFQTRLIGIQVRSMISAAIYQKQLRLSNVAKMTHSSGEIVNYVTADAYRIGEFPYWSHQIWTTVLQLCLVLGVVFYSVGLATVAALATVILIVIASFPIVRIQHKCHSKLMVSQDRRLKAMTEALGNMRILKSYAWEGHFKNVIEGIRKKELQWISKLQLIKGLNLIIFWLSPILVPAITFWACYFLGIPLTAGTLFTFLASVRIVQEPVRLFPDVAKAYIEAKVSLDRIEKFLDAPELENKNIRQTCIDKELHQSIFIRCGEISWDTDPSSKAAVRNIDLVIKSGEKVAICGEVGSGKSTLLAAILGEIPRIDGTVHVCGKIAYVSQTAWIQSGTIQENILFGSAMDPTRYHDVLERCSLVKDLELLPFRDLTQIGERGINLSGGQKQRIQLARALYQDADVYLLDDPFSAVDAHTASRLFNEYVIRALSDKTVLLVTHQVDFLPAFNSILLISAGEILKADTYDQLLASSREFQDLVNAHKTTSGSTKQTDSTCPRKLETSKKEIEKVDNAEEIQASLQDQLIKKEERETGDTGFKPYMQYLRLNKGFLFFSLATLFHATFILGQFIQTYWLAADIQNSNVSRLTLYAVFSIISVILAVPLLLRSLFVVQLGNEASESIFSVLLTSLFRAPISFFDSTPLGRILSRVSSDLSIVDLEIPSNMTITLGATMNTYFSFAVLAFLTWPVLFVIIPMFYLSIVLQRYYFKSTKELMRINGTSMSLVASQLTESISGAMTIRAFGEEDRFFLRNLDLIDANASAYFHTFAANEWLIQRLELFCTIILSSTTLALALLHVGASASGFIGMELSYGLSLNVFLVGSIKFQCFLSESIVSVERLEQYMHIPSEAPDVIECNRPAPNWPAVGKVEICDLKVRYRPNAPLVLQGITCTIEGGKKIGIIGRTGSGKTTLISAIFRLVEPTEGRIVVDDIDICTIGLHDLRAHFAIIPQDPTLFVGSVRYNLDPLSEHTDQEIWEVLVKCQLREAVEGKEDGLNSPVAQDGSNWSMGQRQLFCLGRALLKRSRILVLDEATASIDNATDYILQKTIRTEFADCTVITVAHRIPTVMDCDKVMAISDGKLVEYDEPLKLMSQEGSLFAQLVNEYWSRTENSSNIDKI